MQLAFDLEGNLLLLTVCDAPIQVFGPLGQKKETIGAQGTGPQQLQSPRGIAIDNTGRLLVTDWFSKVQMLDPRSGSFIKEFTAPELDAERPFHPLSIAVDGISNIIVCDFLGGLKIFDAEGQYLRSFGGSGNPDVDSLIILPQALAIDKANNIIVGSFSAPSSCVKMFSNEGKFLMKLNTKALENSVLAVTLDTKDNLIVLNQSRGLIFTPKG